MNTLRTKAALIRDPSVPPGRPAPLHVRCECGARVDMVPPLSSRCPDCGLTYDAAGYIEERKVRP